MDLKRTVFVTVASAGIGLIGLSVGGGSFGGAHSAQAQTQNRDQQKCITSVNKAGAKVASAQSKAMQTCLKFAQAAKLPALGITAQDCPTTGLIADKIAAADAKVVATVSSKCSAATPDFGFSDANTVNTAARGEELDLLTALFGNDLQVAVDAATTKGEGSCQRAIVKAADKLIQTQLKEFGKCKKSGLQAGTINSANGITACLSAVQPGSNPKVEKARVKLASTQTKRCAGVDTDLNFPGECALGDGALFLACVTRESICASCEMLATMDAVPSDCDVLDNGILDFTCTSFCEVGGDCTSGVCLDNACQAPACDDGVLNGDETDLDCGGSCGTDCTIGESCLIGADCTTGICNGSVCTCGDNAFTFNMSSNNGGVFDSAEWPGGTASQNNGSAACSVTIRRPQGNIDAVGTLGDAFRVESFTGFAACFGSGGEDGDGCKPNGCPPAGIGSCEAARPSCSAALNGSGAAQYFVQCND